MATSVVDIQDDGWFGCMLCYYLHRRGTPAKDIAARCDTSYEHIRKMIMGLSAPSPGLLKQLCKELRMDFADAKRRITLDRARRSLKHFWQLADMNPELAPLYYRWDFLSQHSKQSLYAMAQAFAEMDKDKQTQISR